MVTCMIPSLRGWRRACCLALFGCAAFVLAPAQHAVAQSYRSTVNDGNDLYRQKQYDLSKEQYRRAATLDTGRIESPFNLGNAEYRTDNFPEALGLYKKAGEKARSTGEASRLFYNAGTTFLAAADKGVPAIPDPSAGQGDEARMKDYRHAIGMFKEALKLDPKDEQARYNLMYALRKLRDLENQQKNKNDDKKQKQDQKNEKNQDDKNKDKDKQDQNNKNDQQDKKDQQDKQQKQDQNQDKQQQRQNDKQDQQEQRKPQDQRQMSKQQAEQILRALERDEKDLQKKLRAKKSVRIDVDKDW